MTRHATITLSASEPTLVSSKAVHSGEDITIQNIDPQSVVYVGNEDVSSISYGFRIEPGGAWSVELAPRNDLFVISGTEGSKVAVIRVALEYQK